MFFLHSDMKNVDFAAGTVLIGRPHVSWLEHEQGRRTEGRC